jgi:activator of HSP90 ATPase
MKNVPSHSVTTQKSSPYQRSLKSSTTTTSTSSVTEEIATSEGTFSYEQEKALKLPIREKYNRIPAPSRLWSNIMLKVEAI